jgi:hypothetical protein
MLTMNKAPDEITRRWCEEEGLDPNTQYDLFLRRHAAWSDPKPNPKLSIRNPLYAIAYAINAGTYEAWARAIRWNTYRDTITLHFMNVNVTVILRSDCIVFRVTSPDYRLHFFLSNNNEWEK